MTNIREEAQDEARGVIGEDQPQPITAQDIFDGALRVLVNTVQDGELMTFGTPDGERIVVVAGGEAAAAVAYALTLITGSDDSDTGDGNPDEQQELEFPEDNDPED